MGIFLKKCYLINDFLTARLSGYKKNFAARFLIISLVSLLFYWLAGERIYLAVFLGFAFEFSTLDLIFNRDFMNVRVYFEFLAKNDLVDDWSFLVSIFIYFLFWGGALIYGVSEVVLK